MNKIRIIIADDEPLARKGIKSLLKNKANIEIIRECKNGREAVHAINQLAPDLVFLDVQMPVFDGFEVLERINLSKAPVIIFVTAYDKYAIQAFEVNALDYLLKPFGDIRFHVALNRALKSIENNQIADLSRKMASLIDSHKKMESKDAGVDSHQTEDMPSRRKYQNRIMVKGAGKISFVDIEEIKWFEALDYYVRIHTGNANYIIRESLKNLEKSLDPQKFVRIHRSAIVRFNEIKSIVSYSTGNFKVLLQDGTKLPLSRKRKCLLDHFLL
ncbi:MAG: response regulator transcription factor [Thermoplasmata archaeon]|nr:MAG: response regulator transcription factor [Thermoplasmata archaeon]